MNTNYRSTSSQVPVMNNHLPVGFNIPQPFAFKTSNPQIFPSLNPLGGLQRVNKVNTPQIASSRQLEPQAPVKKIKTTNGPQIASAMKKNDTSRDRDNDLMKLKKQVSFKMPTLPKRLIKEKTAEEMRAEDYSQRLKEFKSVGDAVFDNRNNEVLKNLQNQVKTEEQVSSGVVKNESNDVPANSAKPQAQIPGISSQDAGAFMLWATYKSLEKEFEDLLMIQNLLNMNQQKL